MSLCRYKWTICFVRRAYRVWHGASPGRCPPSTGELFAFLDGRSQSQLDRFKPDSISGGLNVGGWFRCRRFRHPDALAATNRCSHWQISGKRVRSRPRRNDCRPAGTLYRDTPADSKPDVLQQMRHSVLQLAALVNAIGYAIRASTNRTCTNTAMGDAVTKTDGTAGTLTTAWRSPTVPCPQLRNCCRTGCLSTCLPAQPFARQRGFADVRVYMERRTQPQSRQRGESPTPFNRFQQLTASECHTAFELWRATGNAIAYKHG